MDEQDELASFRTFEKMGEAEVRGKLLGQWIGTTAMQARLWLAKIEAERERARLAEEARKRAEEMALTQRATEAAERAAEASERATYWTRTAAVASAVAAIAAAVSAAWPWIATVWKLPGAPK
jgi:hypothetical protein